MAYQIGKCLGSGSYGKVYSVSNLLTRRNLALKRLLIYSATNANYIISLKELDMLSRFNHPHIMNLTDVIFDKEDFSPIEVTGMKDDCISIIMPEAKTTLDKYIVEHKNLSTRKNILHQLISGLHHIHQYGFIHRDLKPQNILMFEDGTAKIADLGLTVPFVKCEPRTPGMVTIWYRSPEIFHGQDYDYKADIWSMGCIFYEIIIGRPLFTGMTDEEMLKLLDIFYGKTNSRTRRKYVVGLDFKGLEHLLHRDMALSYDKIQEFDQSPGTYAQFINLVSRMLRSIPSERPNAMEIINHPFFDGYRDKLTVTIFPPPKPQNIYIHPLRTTGIKIINRQKKCEFRVRFLSLDILDRILEQEGEELEEQMVRKYALCSYYIAEKFLLGESARAFSELIVSSSSDYEDYKELEKKVLKDILKYKIYRKTIYDYLPPNTKIEEIERSYYLYTHIKNLTGIRLDHFYHTYKYVTSNWKNIEELSDPINIPLLTNCC